MTQIQKNIVHEEIVTLMETIREQFDALGTFEGRIPVLEFEIIKDNVRNLYEKLYLLQRLNDPFDTIRHKEPETPPVKQESAPPVEEPVPVPSIPSFTPSFTVKIDEDQPVPEPEPVPESEPEPEPEQAPVKETLQTNIPRDVVLGEKPRPAEIKTASDAPDLFSPEPSVFSEKLMEAREQALGTRSREAGQPDIKSLININEKFLFINELFDGDYKEYTRTIEEFNTFGEKAEAFGYLDMLLKENLWNSASTAFVKLKEVVEKKFS